MKKLLLLVALAFPSLGLVSCWTNVKVPTDAASIIKAGHEAFPLPEVQSFDLPHELKPSLDIPKPAPKPVAKPKVHHAPVGRPVRPPLPQARPPAAKAPVVQSEDALPPQQGVVCIFPFNMIPRCTPEPAGRQP